MGRRKNSLRWFLGGCWILLAWVAGCGTAAQDAFPTEIDLPSDSLHYHFHLDRRSDSLFILRTRTDPPRREIRDFRVPFPVYQFQAGDLNENRQPDCLIGVIKTTPHDPVLRRRLFIYELRGNRFHKLWEGSRLVHPLADFRLLPSTRPPEVLSLEYEREKGLYCVARYHMGSFGLELIGYQGRDLDSLTAKTLFEP